MDVGYTRPFAVIFPVFHAKLLKCDCREAWLEAGGLGGAAVWMLMEKTVRNHNLYIPANCFCTIS